LDEPSQYLDESKKKVLLQFLENLLSRGKTLLLVEHNRDWLPKGWEVQELKIEDNTLKQGAKWTI
jgi:energy-coupling factor transporter ATP-binding protein EcfA2